MLSNLIRSDRNEDIWSVPIRNPQIAHIDHGSRSHLGAVSSHRCPMALPGHGCPIFHISCGLDNHACAKPVWQILGIANAIGSNCRAPPHIEKRCVERKASCRWNQSCRRTKTPLTRCGRTARLRRVTFDVSQRSAAHLVAALWCVSGVLS